MALNLPKKKEKERKRERKKRGEGRVIHTLTAGAFLDRTAVGSFF
jgi:hypothetical protein